MKQIVTILLATLILLQPFSKICIYVSFKINQDRIAKTLCVQKEIKNNCCKGKCHLEKELKKAEVLGLTLTQNFCWISGCQVFQKLTRKKRLSSHSKSSPDKLRSRCDLKNTKCTCISLYLLLSLGCGSSHLLLWRCEFEARYCHCE